MTESGQAAMAFAVDFGYGTIAATAHFPIGSMPFPEITTATTPLSANVPARSGNAAGGTSYMIPARTSGNALKASILFLQFMSAPKYITKWLAETGGIAAVQGITPPASTAAYFEGAWGQPEIINPFTSSGYDIAPECSSPRPTTATSSVPRRSARRCPTWRVSSSKARRT